MNYSPEGHATSANLSSKSNFNKRTQPNKKESITLSLLVRGDTPKRSGINWGQRSDRHPNQAYLSLPAFIQRSGFFPERVKDVYSSH